VSLTLSGAIKARVESGGLRLSVYRDLPPDGTPLPYAVCTEGIARPIEPNGDAGAQLETREEVQLDVWQALTDPTTRARTERPNLALQVAARVHMHTVEDVEGGRVYPLRVRDVRRVPQPDKNLVRDTITLSALRTLGATT
jgi:hypothetical protein